MGPIDFLWHLGNLFAVSVLFGLLAAGGAKLLWRRDLASVRWSRLALAASLAAMGVTLAGLLVFGRDGRMATYALMVLAGAVAVGWVGFRRR
jgi:hypothetical protein